MAETNPYQPSPSVLACLDEAEHAAKDLETASKALKAASARLDQASAALQAAWALEMVKR